MSQTIPITLNPVPVPVGISAATIDQLLTVICQYVQGQISDDVTFVLTGAADPTAFVTLLFFNTAQGVWKYWDAGLGAYVAVTQFQPGDIKNTFISGDEIQQGWVLLDGRAISAIQGLSQTQAQVLQTLFGAQGSLPTVTPLQSLANLPAANAFSAITVAAIAPPAGTLSALPFSSSYNPVESQNLAGGAETLRGSTADLQASVTAIQGVASLVLNSLNNAGAATIYAKIFVSFP